MVTEEMKKIWRPWTVFLLVVLGFVYYTMFLEFYLDYFPNGAQNAGILFESRELLESYGTRISEGEMATYKAGRLPKLHKEADRFVRESGIGKKYGITTYEEYAAFRSKANEEASIQDGGADQIEAYADSMRLGSYLQGEETGNIEGRLYGASWMVKTYQARQVHGVDLETGGGEDSVAYSQKELEHARQAFYGKDKMWQNVLPPELPEAISSYCGYLLVWICLSACMLLSPLLVQDRMSRMIPLQYSSKRGRSIYASQFAAAMLTAFLAASANLLVFGGLFFTQGTAVFFPCRMYSFAMMQYCWPDWTHGAWCLVLVALCYLTALGTAGIVFFLSRKCANYIVLLLKILPVAVVMAVLSPKMLKDALYYKNALYRFCGVPYAEPICASIIFTVGMVLCWAGKKQVEKDV